MEITIEIRSGSKHNDMVTKADVQKNIDALSRAIEGKPRASDFVLLIDTRSILEGIQQQLQH